MFMKARVFVSLKPTVLDPQGQTIRSALNGQGHPSIADVRQGKYFDIVLADGTDAKTAAEPLKTAASTNVGCKEFFPSVGMTLSVPCQ